MSQKKEKCAPCRKASIGGQALMEGIMMRGPEKSAMAVRRPNGEMYFEEEQNQKKQRPAVCRWPIVRGVFGFVDSMVIGYKYLMRSAEISCEEVEEKKESEEPATEAAQSLTAEAKEQAEPVGAKEKGEEKPKSILSDAAMTAVMIIATVLGFLLAIGLFVYLPTLLYSFVSDWLPRKLARSRFVRSLFEGLLKIAVLVVYMALVSLMKDIRRTFMYHGAEHKTIFCYENGEALTVENVRRQRRFHPRCGTSFLILMLIVGVLIGMLIPTHIKGVSKSLYTVVRTLIKLLLIPLIMGIGYELLKLAGKHDNLFTRIISAPGLWLQRITVKEPTDDMIECAIRAFVAVMPAEEKAEEAVAALDEATREDATETDGKEGN